MLSTKQKTNKISKARCLHWQILPTFIEEIMSGLHRPFQKMEKDRLLPKTWDNKIRQLPPLKKNGNPVSLMNIYAISLFKNCNHHSNK